MEHLDQYLRNFVSANQQKLADYMGLIEFIFNVATHLTTKLLFFKVDSGVDPLHLFDLAFEGAPIAIK